MTEEEVGAVVEEVEVVCCGQLVDGSLDQLALGQNVADQVQWVSLVAKALQNSF